MNIIVSSLPLRMFVRKSSNNEFFMKLLQQLRRYMLRVTSVRNVKKREVTNFGDKISEVKFIYIEIEPNLTDKPLHVYT